jgi:hypothetical protein
MTRTSIGDPRFFAQNGSHPLATVAEMALGAAPEVDLLCGPRRCAHGPSYCAG